VGSSSSVLTERLRVASAMCGFVLLAGQGLVAKYRLSVAGLDIAGGLVLLIAALKTTFSGSKAPRRRPTAPRRSWQLAMSPLASPAIIRRPAWPSS